MVAIVSGNSLGLELTSRDTLGGRGIFGLAGQGNAGELVHVNAATGNLVLQRRDEFVASRGEDLGSIRTYNSLGLLNDDNADNWSIGIYRQQLRLTGSVNTAGSSLVRTARDGSQATYLWDTGRGLYVTADGAGAHDTITYDAATAQYKRTDGGSGCIETYAGNTSRLIRFVDANGAGADYAYNDAGLLTKATSTSGDTTWYDYQGTQLDAIRSQIGEGANAVTRTAARYGYDTAGRLASVTIDLMPDDGSIADGRVYTINYTYDGASHRLQTVSQSGGTALTFTYVEVLGDFRVATITDALGSVTSFRYDPVNRRTTVTDPLNKAWQYDYDSTGQLVGVTAPATATMPASVQSFAYDSRGNVISLTNGDGEVVSMTYDDNGNQLSQTDHLGHAIARTYSASNQLLTETVTTATGGATTRYVYAAGKPNQLRFIVSAEGRVTQFGYDSLGQRTTEVIYSQTRYATSSLPAESALTEADLVAWVGGITDLSSTVRKDYGYDPRGLLSYSREYLSTNASGSGNTIYQTDYTYDAAGRLLQQRLPASGTLSGDEAGQPTITTTYDGLGRVLTVRDARGALTSTVYADSTRKATVTVENGPTATSVYDKAGRLISLTRSGAGTATYAYDAAGGLLMSVDANGVRAFSLYDDAGRRVATIDGTGTLTEFSYDGAGRLTRQIVYSTAVPASALFNAATGTPTSPSLATIRPAANALDLQTWQVWDDAGRLAYAIGDDGAVVEHEYDGAGRAVRTTAYAAAIAPAASPTVGWVRDQLQSEAVTSSAAANRTTRSFYDADGLRIAELDGEGFLTRHTYDNAGRRVQTRRYATAVVPGLRADGQLSAITPATHALDQIDTFFYDARGQLVGQVDAEGYLTRNWYSTRGQLLDQTRYAAKLAATPVWTDDLDTLIKTIRPGGATALEADDRKSYWRYALDGNVIRHTNFEGTVTSYTYDTRGRLIRTIAGDGLADARELQVRYDSFGRKTAELSAVGSSLITAGMTQAQIDAVWASHGIDYTYNAAGQLVAKTDANGNKTLYYYDDDGRPVVTVNARGEVQQTRYNALGQRTAVVRYGTRISVATLVSLAGGRFSGSSLETTLTGIADATTDSRIAYAYDGAGRLLSVTNAVGARTTNAYNAFGELTEQWVAWRGGVDINTDRRQDLYTYDRRGLLVQSNKDATGTNARTAARHDAFGRLIESTDANGARRTFAYDRLGRQVVTTDALNRSCHTSYDAFSQVLSIGNELGKITRYSYDKASRTVTMTTPENVEIITASTRFGQTYTITDGNRFKTVLTYDRNGNLTKRQVGATVVEQRAYDAGDRLIETIDANGVSVTTAYDAANRLLTRTVDPKHATLNPDGLNLVTRYDIDAKGLATTVTDPEGGVTRYEFDLEGRVLKQTVEMGSTEPSLVTIYTRDADGDVLTVTEPGGKLTRHTYDRLGRRIKEQIDPDDLNLTRSMAYDDGGNVVTVTDPRNGLTRYAYDANGRQTYAVDATGASTKTEYDDAGRIKRITRFANAMSLTGLPAVATGAQIQSRIDAIAGAEADQIDIRCYDDDGRLSHTVDGTGAVVKLQLDGNGNVTRRTAYANAINLKSWNAAGDPPVVSAGSLDHVQRFFYDSLGRQTYAVKIENAADGKGSVTAFFRDANGNITRQVQYADKIDANADPQSVVPSGGLDRITVNRYDHANRLIWQNNAAGGVTKLGYDNSGNLTSRTEYAKLIAAGAEPGTAAAGADPVNDRVTRMSYDKANRLTYTVDAMNYVQLNDYGADGRLSATTRFAAALPAGKQAHEVAPSADDRTERFTYDGAGRLQSRADAVGSITFYTYNALGLMETETAAKGLAEQTITRYSHDAAGHLLATTTAYGTAAASTAKYEVDALGQVVAQTDPRGTALTTSDRAWAQAERRRLGYADSVADLSAAAKTALLAAYTSHHDYDGAGRRTSTTNAVGATSRTAFDAFGNAIKVTDPLGHSAYFYYDGLDRVTLQVDAERFANEISYASPFGNQVSSVWRRATQVPAGTTEATRPVPVPNASYDARLQYAEYDRLDRLIKSANHLGDSETIVYGVNANRFDKQITNKLGGKVTYAFDRLGRQVSETLPVNRTKADGSSAAVVNEYRYNAFGDRIAMIEAVGLPEQRSTSFRFDKMGRVTHRIGSAFTAFDAAAGTSGTITPVQVTSYDRLGRVIGEIANANWTNGAASGGEKSFTYYDAAGLKTMHIAADGGVTQWSYDPAGNVHQEASRALPMALPVAFGGTPEDARLSPADDRVTTSIHDAAGRLIERRRDAVVWWEHVGAGKDIILDLTGSQPSTITLQQNVYDGNGNLVQETDARGNIIYNYFDKLGRRVLRIDQEGYATGWTYGDVFDSATQEVRYAQRVAQFARQDDGSKVATLRTPADLVADLASDGNRTTQFKFDRAGRNTEKRVLEVAYQYVGSAGGVTSGSIDAITRTSYDGMGNIEKIEERVALLSDGTTNVWNVTDIEYDKLGRRIKQQAPSFVDHLNAAVRPTTTIEYDGLGNVVCEIRLGTHDAVDIDDRITRYGYDRNGRRIKITDAAGNETDFELDAAGRIARQTLKALDIVTTYRYDAKGRVTQRTDGGTGEVRRFRYNAFDQITGKGLGAGNVWQEFIEYSTLGKIQRSNADGGVTKIYLYDKNGNATREICNPGGEFDLITMRITDAAANGGLVHTFSVYDKRNLLQRTVEPDISFYRDHIDGVSGAFTQALITDPYAAIALGGSGGERYTNGTVNASSYAYTTVGGANSSDSQKMREPVAPTITAPTTLVSRGEAPNLAPLGAYGFSASWSGYQTIYRTIDWPAHKYFSIPSTWPNLSYRLTDRTNNAQVGSTMQRGTSVAVPGQRFVQGDGYDLEYQIYAGGPWVPVIELHYNVEMEPGLTTEIWRSSTTGNLIIPARKDMTKVIASIGTGTGSESSVPCALVVDSSGKAVPGYWAVNTSGLAAGTHTITIRGLDANGNIVAAERMPVTVGSGCTLGAKATLSDTDVWASTTYATGNTRGIFFAGDTLGGTGAGTLHYRVAGSSDNWSSLPLSNWSVNVITLPPSKSYEYIVQSSGGKEYAGKFALDATRIPTLQESAMLSTVTRVTSTLITFDVKDHIISTGAATRKMILTLNGKEVGKTLTGTTVSFDAASFGVVPDRWTNKAYDYSYRVTGEYSQGGQFIGQGTGKLQLGCDPKATNTPTTTAYRPLALLTLPSGTSLSGSIVVTPSGSTAVSIPAGDWRRQSLDSTHLGIDLSQWLAWGAAEKTITVSYTAGDAIFTGSFKLKGTGQTDCSTLTSSTRQPLIPITVPSATRLSVLKVGPSDTELEDVSIATRVTTSGSTFTWKADDQAGKGPRRFYYEAVNAAGTVIGKGYGSFTLATTGTLHSEMDTPLLKPSLFSFGPPVGTATFELRTRPRGSTGAYTIRPVTPPTGSATKTFDATTLKPTTGSAVLEYLQVAKDAEGTVLSSGGGLLTIQASGAVSSTHYEDRQPTIVTLQGPPGRSVPKMEIGLRSAGSAGAYTPTVVTGVWDANAKCTVFKWNATNTRLSGSSVSVVPEAGTVQYDYLFRLLNANGTPFANELGDPITMDGVMTLGGGTSSPVTLQQRVTTLAKSTAQVQHHQAHNAFGEISEEYDDEVYDRAVKMAELYGGSADASAVRTTFAYNTLGQLLTKSDPQTHVTADNGFRYRARPVTRYGYDLTGRLSTIVDANGVLSKQRFDGAGEQLTMQWAGDGALSKTAYDIFGEQRRATDAAGKVTEYTNDKLGHLLTATQLDVTRRDPFTDANTVAKSLTDTYVHDALGRRIKHTNALGWADTTYYDSLGRVVRTVSAGGRNTTYTYAFVAAGTAASSGGILGAGGANLGGWQLTTLGADGRKTVDRTDYFGRTTWHQDQDNRTYVYTYDFAGRLSSQTSSKGQNIRYDYYANGFIKESRDLTTRMMSRFGYDNAGNRVWEMYSGLDAGGTAPVGLYQDSEIQYDELGRMARIDDVSADILYEYDAVGNRRAVRATYLDPLWHDVRRREDFWYTYDGANRFTMTMGTLEDNRRGSSLGDGTARIVQGVHGVALTYNGVGRRTSARYAGGTLEAYYYSSDGFLEDTYITPNGKERELRARRRVDALGRTLQYKEYGFSGTLERTTDSVYDRDNRLLSTRDDQGKTDYFYFINTNDIVGSATASGSGALAKTVFTAVDPKATAVTMTYSYQYWDSAKQTAIMKKASNEAAPNWAPGMSSMSYDVNGFLASARSVGGEDGDRQFTYFNASNGQVLRRDEIREHSASTVTDDVAFAHYWYYANGRRVGEVTTDPDDNQRISYAEALAISLSSPKKLAERHKQVKPVTSADFDQNYEPVGPNYPASTPSTYIARTGDTLRSVAQALWGDADMWYLLAQTNNLAGDERLVAGQVLVVPNKVTNIHNNADTFRPYNPGEVIGHIDPTLPAPPPPADQGGCGGLGVVLMIVVAIAVTVVTTGVAVTLLAPGGTLAGASVGSLAAAGASVLTGAGGFSAIGVASAAVGAAAGSVASQLVGMAIGQVDDFSWKAVAHSALGAGVAAGVGGALHTAGVLETASTTANVTSNGIGVGGNSAPLVSSSGSWMSAAGKAALSGGLSAAATQAIQGQWSWRDIAANAVGAAAGSSAGQVVGTALQGVEAAAFATRVASNFVGALAADRVRATDPDYTRAGTGSLFVSSLGNAVGQGLVDEMQAGVDWSTAPDQSDAETARLNRYGADAAQSAQTQAYYDQIVGAFGGYDAGAPDRSRDILLALLGGRAAVDPGSMESIRQPDGAYRVDIAGTSDSPVLYGSSDGGDDLVTELPPVIITGKRMTDAEAAAYDAQLFQETSDTRVVAGTYDRFAEIASAWSDGRYGDIWRHVSFEASESTRAAAFQRLFPQPSPTVVRIDSLIASPIGAGVSGIANLMGASEQTQDALLGTLGALEQLAGVGTGVYKQTITAKAPMPGGLASAPRGPSAPFSPLSQPGGLAATEGSQVRRADGRLSDPTHPLVRHGPDVSDQYVMNRVIQELQATGRTGLRTAFNDRARMEAAIAETFAARQQDINAWLRSSPRAGVPRAFDWDPGMGNLGRGFETTTPGGPIVPINRPMPNVNLVLIPDSQGGYFIHTAYPKP